MKKSFILVPLAVVMCALACRPQDRPQPTTTLPQPPAPSAEQGGGVTGRVAETMDSGGYTYVLIDDGTRKVWAAGPQTPVRVGDQVSIPTGMEMTNFKSPSLGRTFDTIYFVGAIKHVGAAGGDRMASAHRSIERKGAEVDLTGIDKAAGGYTVSELFARRSELAGHEVAVRGKVVKFTAGVMGKNWIHLRDGSGEAGSNDLTVTTDATAKVGDTVLVRGKLATDRDLGYGYKYAVIVEDAQVTVE